MNTAQSTDLPRTAHGLGAPRWTLSEGLTEGLAWLQGVASPLPQRHYPATLPMTKGQTRWVAKPLGRRITCEAGSLWLCFDGEPVDITLEPGQSHLFAHDAALSIHAFSAASVKVA